MDFLQSTELLHQHLSTCSFLTVKTLAKRTGLKRKQVSFFLRHCSKFKMVFRTPYSHNKHVIWTLA